MGAQLKKIPDADKVHTQIAQNLEFFKEIGSLSTEDGCLAPVATFQQVPTS